MTLAEKSGNEEQDKAEGIDRRKFIERFLKAGACAAPLVYVLFDPSRSLGLIKAPTHETPYMEEELS